ncbi:hypothetical protein [Streptomyces sp. NBC_00459]
MTSAPSAGAVAVARPAVGARGALFVVGQYGAAVLVFARAS